MFLIFLYHKNSSSLLFSYVKNHLPSILTRFPFLLVERSILNMFLLGHAYYWSPYFLSASCRFGFHFIWKLYVFFHFIELMMNPFFNVEKAKNQPHELMSISFVFVFSMLTVELLYCCRYGFKFCPSGRIPLFHLFNDNKKK